MHVPSVSYSSAELHQQWRGLKQRLQMDHSWVESVKHQDFERTQFFHHGVRGGNKARANSGTDPHAAQTA